jgi:hypothetical protein
MRWPTLAAAVIATVGLMGCDRIPFIGGGEEASSTTDTFATQQADTVTPTAGAAAQADTTTATAETQAQPEVEQPASPPPAPTQQVSRPATASGMDEPWNPTHTGTVNPGMTRADVVGVWGEPVTERSTGEWAYLYYRNGCEYTCGTFDVVMLQSGQVVDAIVRGPGHTFAGMSSSPPDRQARFTPPGGGSGEIGMAG